MTAPRRIAVIFAGLLAAPLLAADPSHVPLPDEGTYDLNAALARRLLRDGLPKDSAKLKDIMEQLEKAGLGKAGDLQELAKDPRIKEMMKDPALRQRAEEMLRNQAGQGPIDPKRITDLFKGGGPGPQGGAPEFDKNRLPRPGRLPNPPAPGEGPPRLPPDIGPGRNTPENTAPPPESFRPATGGNTERAPDTLSASPPAEQPRDSRMQDLAGRLERFVGPLGHSPAVREALRDLGKLRLGSGTSGLNTDTLTRQFERFGDYADRTGAFWNRNVAPNADFRMPSFNSPNMSGSSFPSAPRAPSVGGSGVSAPGGDSWIPVVALGLLAFAGLLYWRFMTGEAVPTAGRDPSLGPWPVDPNGVSTRGQLVQAFEYLTVLRCGRVARVWNHRVVGGEIRADRLAGLYEKARYSPPAEPLTESDLSAARRDLTQLAGKSSA
jgi:hypothetical protein